MAILNIHSGYFKVRVPLSVLDDVHAHPRQLKVVAVFEFRQKDVTQFETLSQLQGVFPNKVVPEKLELH